MPSADVLDDSLTGADVDESSLDSAVLQFRVGNTCSPGSSIRAIATNGTVECEADDEGSPGPTYQAGDGLALDGDTFKIRQDCGPGDILKYSAFGWQCDTDTNSGGDITSVTTAAPLTGGSTAGDIALGIALNPTGGLGLLSGQLQLNPACSLNQVLKKNAANQWACAADADSGGDVTGVTATGPLGVANTGGPVPNITIDTATFKPACQAGYFRNGELCWLSIDTGGHTYAQATELCRSQNARLPSYAELLGLAMSGIAIPNGGIQLDWASDVPADDQAVFINSNTPPNMDGVAAQTATNFARCVHTPVPAIGFAP